MDLFLSIMKTLEMSPDFGSREPKKEISTRSSTDEHPEFGHDQISTVLDHKQLYEEFLRRYLKTRPSISNNYFSFLFVPVLIMFITISWHTNSLIFKSIITFLVISHTIVVTNKLTTKSTL